MLKSICKSRSLMELDAMVYLYLKLLKRTDVRLIKKKSLNTESTVV